MAGRCCLPIAVALLLAGTLAAEPTRIDVRVRSKGAKFVGTSMGGAQVLIRNAATGELLAKGVTKGGTGDTKRLMIEPRKPGEPVATPGAAVFETELDVEEPIRIRVEARGPLAQPQSINSVAIEQWLLPGKQLTGGDGLLLELPGFAVDVLAPAAHATLSETPRTVEVEANVVMMCGCPIEPGGLWDANDFEIEVVLQRDGETVGTFPMEFAGKTSRFRRELAIEQPGTYQATVTAYDPDNGNTGLDRTTFVVAE